MIKWFKTALGLEKEETELIKPIVEETKSIGVVQPVRFLEYIPTGNCKIHRDYSGMIPPSNNCNGCWEYYSKKIKH